MIDYDIKVRQLLTKWAPEMDEDSINYLAAVLMDQEKEDYPETLSQLLDESQAQKLAKEVENLMASHQPQALPLQATNDAGSLSQSHALPEERATKDSDMISESSDSSIQSLTKTDRRKSKRATRREEKMKKKKEKLKAVYDDFVDDDVSAWNDRLSDGKSWGGRGCGGRGIRGDVNTATNIHLSNVTLQFAGKELLQKSTIQISGGHRYGLVGRNGVGKSTLLRRLADHAVPGIPHELRILLVKQQVDGSDQTALEFLLMADQQRAALLKEQLDLEDKLEKTDNLEEIVERLSAISSDLAVMDPEKAERKARQILEGLQFSNDMIETPTYHLSGGWRMRLALAQALFVPSDLLLLDEPTNHLDLYALTWLKNYLEDSNHTIIMVSHDRMFLDVCTDIIAFEHQKLKYHPGNYSSYELYQQEKAAHQARILDGSERQRAKALAFVRKQETSASKKKADPNKQRQAKMIKEKKLARIGNYRDDGKKYKNFSLSKLSEDAVRVAQKVHVEADDPTLKMRFPDPSWPVGMSAESTLIEMDGFSFGYDNTLLLDDVTLNIQRGSKVAVCGRNGAGKTTLLKLLVGEYVPNNESDVVKGNICRNQSLRIGHVTQYSIEALEAFANMTVVEYAEETFGSGEASTDVMKKASGNIRQYLGSFGLGGNHAHRTIGCLSGGERMRLSFAAVLADKPQLLVLDEPTNHLDIETLDALSAALDDFKGAVIVVSHNQGFLCRFCEELWVVDSGRVDVRHRGGDTFENLFAHYRHEALEATDSRKTKRQVNIAMTRKAISQRAGVAMSGVGFIP